jgi:hypothetical protein
MVATRGFLRSVAVFTVAASALAGSLVAVSTAVPANAASAVASIAGGPTNPSVTPTGTLTVTTTITNKTNRMLAAGNLSLTPSSGALRDETALNTWLAGKGFNANSIGEVAVGAIAPRSKASVSLSVPARALPEISVWGVRGLLLNYTQNGKVTAATRSSVVLLAANAPKPVSLATILPLVGPPSALGMMTSQEITTATGPAGYLRQELALATPATITLAVDPRITTSILALGSAAPTSGVSWLKALTSSSKTGFWLTYADSDTSGLIQSGTQAPLSPSIDDVANLPAPAANTSWGGSNWPGWAPTLSGISWPLANTVSKKVLSTVAAAGDHRMILSGENIDGPIPASSVGRIGATKIVAVNSPASACAQALQVSESSAARASAAACLAARIAVAASASGQGASVVIALARSHTQFSAGAFGATIDSLSSLPFAQPVTLDSILTAQSSEVVLKERSESQSRLKSLKRVAANQTKIEAFAPVAEFPDVVINPGERRFAAIASSAWSGTQDWNLGLESNASLTREVLGSVSIVTSSTINMVSGQARIPVVVRNGLGSRVSVIVRAVPSNPRITVAGEVPLKIEANAQARAYIPVSARVGNGRVTLEVSLTDTAGALVGSVTELPVNVRADWESFGMIGLAVVFFALIIAGVIRTVRRNKRRASAHE